MRRFLLDTNICLAIIRGHQLYGRVVSELALDADDSLLLISVVTKAELLALGKKLGWGSSKMVKLNHLLDKLFIIDIGSSDDALIKAYYTIDAYSQGVLKDQPLNQSARNMGKNDLWIAATSLVANAELITTDRDFNHLDGSFLKVHTYPLK